MQKVFSNTITGVIYEPIKYGYAFTPLQMEELINLQVQKQNGCRRGYLHKWSRFRLDLFLQSKTSTDKWITTRQTVAVIGNHVFAK